MKKHFKPTAKRINTKFNLARSDSGWTTNGQWMILTKHEPKWLQKIKTDDFRDYKVEPVIENSLKDIFDIDLTGRMQYLDPDDVILAEVNAKFEDFTSWVNVYYLAIFDHLVTDLQQSSPTSAIVIKSYGEVVGLVMPSRLPEEF